MSDLFLNAPLWLIVLLAILGLGTLVSALRRQDTRLRSIAIGCLAITVSLVLLKYLAPSDQKNCERDTRKLVDAISKSDWATTSTLLQDANLFEWHGQEITDHVKSAAGFYHMTDVQINSTESERKQSIITVTISVTSHHQSDFANSVPSTWQMDWQKRSGGWILTDLHPLKIATWGPVEAEGLIRHGA